MSKQWFAMNKRGDAAELAIYSDIGKGGITPQEFYESLSALGKPARLNVRINSNGGDVAHGFAIHSILSRHPAHKVVTVDGVAASIASVIAMAGDEIVMPQNAMMMIHNPWGVAAGGSKEIASFAEALEIMRDGIVHVYSERTKLSADRIKAMMDRETRLSAKDAKSLGFATHVVGSASASRDSVDLSRFTKAPKALADASIEAAAARHRADVSKLCRIAGKPWMAANLIAEGISLSDALAKLQVAHREPELDNNLIWGRFNQRK